MPKAKEQSVTYIAKKKPLRRTITSSPKQQTLKMLRNLRDDATYEDIMYKLYVLTNIQKGLDDIEAGRIISHEDVKKSLKKWLV